MTPEQLLEAVKSKITDRDLRDMIESYERLLKTAVMCGHHGNAKRYSETLSKLLSQVKG